MQTQVVVKTTNRRAMKVNIPIKVMGTGFAVIEPTYAPAFVRGVQAKPDGSAMLATKSGAMIKISALH